MVLLLRSEAVGGQADWGGHVQRRQNVDGIANLSLVSIF